MGNGKSPFGFTVNAAAGTGLDAHPGQRGGGLARSVLIGMLGFGAASLLVFGSWAWMGRWLYGALGEAGTYAVWAVVFIGIQPTRRGLCPILKKCFTTMRCSPGCIPMGGS